MEKRNRLKRNKATLKSRRLTPKGVSADHLIDKGEVALLHYALKGLPALVAQRAKAAQSERYVLNGNTIVAIRPDDTQYTVKTLDLPTRRKIPADKMHLRK